MPLIGPYEPNAYRNSALLRMNEWSIRRKLLVSILVAVALILAGTGFATNWFSSRYLSAALDRTTGVLVMAQAAALEDALEEMRQDLMRLAGGPLNRNEFEQFLRLTRQIKGDWLREAGFVGQVADRDFYFACSGGEPQEIPARDVDKISPSPLAMLEKLASLKAGETALGEISQIFYPLASRVAAPRQQAVLRMATPVFDASGARVGYVFLGVDGARLRDILSLYNSPKSPTAFFQRTPERRFSFLFDFQGWTLFQSEGVDESGQALSTSVARIGLSGDHGKPGLDVAFRPNAEHEAYWRMIVAAREGKPGIIAASIIGQGKPQAVSHGGVHQAFAWAPVRFLFSPAAGPEPLAGVAFVDRSLMTMAAEFRQIDVMAIITLASFAFMAFVLLVISRVISRPIANLEHAVRDILEEGFLREIDLPDQDFETSSLKRAINTLIRSILSQREELRLVSMKVEDAKRRERAPAAGAKGLRDEPGDPFSGMIGAGQALRRLKTQISKTASVDADVLIVGETGVGKELTAEAIHAASARKNQPFVSVNCGALDENLLLDALFGHVKGAFSEARTDRKGAFLTADGGTLFLDEIGNASLKVQQALLRTLSVRKVRPLGSDVEVNVDVRLVSATNVDLQEAVRRGEFREDLYYRLKVLTLEVPPLRDRKEDVPLLAERFLLEASQSMKRPNMFFTRGAMDKLLTHPWPGNVRELKHTVTRAAAMADSELIHAEDLRFESSPLGLRKELAFDSGEEALPWPTRPFAEDAEGGGGARDHAPLPGDDLPPPSRAGGGGAVWSAASSGNQDGGTRSRSIPDGSSKRGNLPEPPGLNARQLKVWRQLAPGQVISRAEYEKLLGEDIPSRTAQYDLQEMVRKGALRKIGHGPTTRYAAPPPPSDA